jgi:hypothetical protein
VTNAAIRYVGYPDFHDGYVRAVALSNNQVQVTVEGDTGKKYLVKFEGVAEIELFSPQNMMLYAMSETDTDTESLRKYDFINWYVDEPNEPESKAYLRVLAASFTIMPSDAP